MSAAGPADPGPAPPLPPQLLLLERLLAALLLALAAQLLWSGQARARGDEAQLQSLVDALRAQPGLAGAGLLVALTLAGAFLGTVGARFLGALRRGLTAPPRTGLGLGHFLLAYGALTTISALVLGTLPPWTAQVEAAPAAAAVAAPVPLSGKGCQVGGQDAELPLAGPAAARITREAFAALVEALPGSTTPVRIGEQTLAPGERRRLAPGERLEVGPWALKIVGPDPLDAMLRAVLARLLRLALLLGAAWRLGGGALRQAFGGDAAGALDEARRGALGYLGFLPVYGLSLIGSLLAAHALGFAVEDHPLIEVLRREGARLVPWVLLEAGLLAPLEEELLFRGLLLLGLIRALGAPGALLVSALVFGCVHQSLGALAPMVGLGLLFGGLLLGSPRGALLGAMVAHVLHNALTVGLALLLYLSP